MTHFSQVVPQIKELLRSKTSNFLAGSYNNFKSAMLFHFDNFTGTGIHNISSGWYFFNLGYFMHV